MDRPSHPERKDDLLNVVLVMQLIKVSLSFSRCPLSYLKILMNFNQEDGVH